MSRAWQWFGAAAVFNLGWEVAQLPLYTIYSEGTFAEIAFAVAHCTGGDVLIAAASYLMAAAVTRDMRWPATSPKLGTAAAIAVAMAYTAFSEWRNVSVRGAWAYAAAMPQVFGIGLSPLLQWFLIRVEPWRVVSGVGQRGCTIGAR